MIKGLNSGKIDKFDIQTRLLQAKKEAKVLYQELEKVRQSTRDSNLSKISTSIPALNAQDIDLRLYNTLKGHRNKISQMCWNSNARDLLSASQDGFMIIWDTYTGFKKQLIELDNQWVLACAFAPNGTNAACGGLDNTLTVYNVHHVNSKEPNISPNPIRTILKGHKAYISDCKYLSDQSILTASGDGTCALWDLTKSRKANEFTDHVGDVLAVSKFHGSNPQSECNLFVSVSADGQARVWDSRLKASVQTFAVSNNDVTSVQTFPEGYSFITGSDDGIIKMFDTRSDCEINHYSLPSSIYFTDTNNRYQGYSSVALQSSNSHKSHASNRESINSEYDSSGVISLDFSKSGRLIYGSYSDYGCVIWDTLKGTIIGKMALAGHMSRVNQVSVSPDGSAICTASWDQTIKVWSF